MHSEPVTAYRSVSVKCSPQVLYHLTEFPGVFFDLCIQKHYLFMLKNSGMENNNGTNHRHSMSDSCFAWGPGKKRCTLRGRGGWWESLCMRLTAQVSAARSSRSWVLGPHLSAPSPTGWMHQLHHPQTSLTICPERSCNFPACKAIKGSSLELAEKTFPGTRCGRHPGPAVRTSYTHTRAVQAACGCSFRAFLRGPGLENPSMTSVRKRWGVGEKHYQCVSSVSI